MRRIAFDVETHLIKPGMLFPRLVCVSFAERDASGNVRSWIEGPLSGVQEVLRYLADPDVVLVGHNTSFDIGVILAEAIILARAGHILSTPEHKLYEVVFRAYEQDRITDTMIRTMLVDIARGIYQFLSKQRGSYTLQKLAKRWCEIELSKEDTWRLHYAFLSDKPISQWPKEAVDYAILDSDTTIRIDHEITQWVVDEGNPNGEMPDTWRQVRAAWVLHLMAGWGVMVDPEMVGVVKANLQHQQKESYKVLDAWGILKKDRGGIYKRTKKGAICKDQKRLQELITEGFAAQGEEPPLTKKGRISVSAETAQDAGHPATMAYADVASADKLLSTYVPILERGCTGLPITSNPNVLVASGRTSWRNPNWQNPPRVGGIRECVISRPGTVLIAADLDTVELRALAQTCLELLGHSEMAAALQRGEDLHLSLAADVLGLDYATAKALYDAGDKLVSDTRQNMKPPNFGFPGGMGAPKFAITQANAGAPLCVDADGNHDLVASIARSRVLRDAWFKRWPEMRAYLAHAGDVVGDFGPGIIEQPWSGRLRGGLDYCSCANTYFQGRVADGTKLALWRIAYACYVDTTSILYGCRLVLFLHDEVILECPEANATECGKEIVRLLCGAVQEVIPDIPITSTAVAMRRWWKGAKPVYLDGLLVPCKPEKDAKGKTKWIPDY